WAVYRHLDAALDVFANGLGIAARSAGDRRHRQALPVQLQDHHGFSKSDHRRRLPKGVIAPIFGVAHEPGLTPAHGQTGPTIREFSKPTFAENYAPTDRSGSFALAPHRTAGPLARTSRCA